MICLYYYYYLCVLFIFVRSSNIMVFNTPIPLFWVREEAMMYRNRLEIISHILEAANGGITKNRMMYKALVSYAQMKENLTALTEKDLLRYNEDTRTFKTTEKGLRFLDLYNRISDMIKAPLPPPPPPQQQQQ
jgi:predicted transcriptional regulator